MNKHLAEVDVYGAAVLCPSCVNLPSSKETYDWLEAAISRKFPSQAFTINYIDIYDEEQIDEEKATFAKRVIDEDMFYPVVVINGEVVGEGNPRLKTIYAALEKCGYIPEEN